MALPLSWLSVNPLCVTVKASGDVDEQLFEVALPEAGVSVPAENRTEVIHVYE